MPPSSALKVRRRAIVETTGPDDVATGSWERLLAEGWGQVSLVEVAPLTFQGWCLHGERDEWHSCIKGRVLIAQSGGQAIPSSQEEATTVLVPRLVIHGIFNAGEESAWVIVVANQPHDAPRDDEWPLPVTDEEIERLNIIWDQYFAEGNS